MSTAEQTETASHEELLRGLTPSEREGLLMAYPDDEHDDEAKPAEAATNKLEVEDDKPEDTKTDKPGADADAPAAVDAAAAPAAPAAEAAPAVADEPVAAPSAPLFVAAAPADADVKLAEIASQKAELRKQHDDGDITTDEMLGKLDVLGKEERAIERAVDRANIAASMEEQRQKNQWDNDCNAFIKANPVYNTDQELFTHLNETVKAFAAMPRNATLSGPALLEKAHNALMAERGTPVQAAAAAAPAPAKAAVKIPAQVVPPSLHSMPAAEQAAAGTDRFAHLAKLNGFELEKALSKMNAEERDAFMAAE